MLSDAGHTFTDVGSKRKALSGHIVTDGRLTVNETQRIINNIERISGEKFNTGHTTIQVENSDHAHGTDMFEIDKNWLLIFQIVFLPAFSFISFNKKDIIR